MKYENERASNKDNMEEKTMEGNIWIFIHVIIMAGSAICLFLSFLSIAFLIVEEDEKGVDSSFKTFIISLLITIMSMVFFIFGCYKCEKSTWNYSDKPYSTEYIATVYKGNIIKNLIMDCQSYTKYRPNETTGGIFVSWRRKEELPTGA